MLFAIVAFFVVETFVLYWVYALAMPQAPDFEAQRTTRMQVGGQLHVYATAGEARFYRIATNGLFFVAFGAGLAFAWIGRRLDDRSRV